MRIYQLDSPGGHHWVMPVEEEAAEAPFFDGVSLADGWRPMTMELITNDPKSTPTGKHTYFPWYLNSVLMLRDEAIDRVGPLVEPYGEILPVNCPEMRLSVFNCLAVEDVLDIEKSDIEYFEPGEVQEVRSFVFRPDRVADLMAFKAREWPAGPLLFTDPMVDALAKTGLGHMDFYALWDSDEGSYGYRIATEFRPDVDRRI